MLRLTPSIAPLFSVVLVLVTGCGSGEVAPPNYGSPEGLKIAQTVSDFNDAKANINTFKKMFVGTAPSNWKEYERVVYEVVVGSPQVDGANATATVTVRNESNYEVIATKEWTFTKVGDAWKIKDAPLK